MAATIWLTLAVLGTALQAISVRGFQFTPADVTTPVGTRILWTNADEIGHTVTSGTPDSLDGRFDGTLEAAGATFSHVFETSGLYPYHCARHPFMRGVVRVPPKGD